ncbi:MAG TPA: DUF2079 domain-containing protein, partial [Thermoplasmata archaeon]|nr:DUF2079 domain-containing protein [Thermoplasmata archaeon]
MAEGFGPSEPGRFWRSLAARFRSAPEIYGLALAIVVFFGASFALSWLRALEFQTTTWDLGILQQALWSTAHGRPFYESADLETGGYQSLLQIHSAFLLYLLVPVYAAWPYPTTLFAVQSAVVASAAIPLFLLGRHVTGSPRLGLVAALAFLGWMPTLASTLYDVHIEALLPLETFSFTYLWARGRYGWGFAVGFVAFLSMELAPVLLFFVGLFFLLPARLELDRLRERFRRAIADPKVLAGVGFLVSCVAAYASLLYLREHYLIQALGFHSLSTGGSGYVIGATPVELGLRASNLSIGFGTKMTNWILLLALLGFVPLLA